VVLLTLDAPVEWVPPNNVLIAETANAYPNVTLLDWAALSGSCPGECFYSDGYHLRPEGQVYYASLVADALQPPG
jgi:hypothetical protein